MDSIHKILKHYFGFDTFRPLQKEIISNILNKKHSLVLMPTGGGKSLCFQIPAIVMEGTALVISPLIALMKDQVENLKANGVQAAFLNSSLTRDEEIQVEDDCRSGKLKLLYISPERALMLSREWLPELKVSMIAIDESHCISQWGHDFRPEYTKLHSLISLFPEIPVVALTATADKTTRKDILKQLSIEDAQVFVSSFDRPNIRLEVRSNMNKRKKIASIVQFISKRIGESGIIYCLSRKNTEDVSETLKQHGISCSYYHAGMNTAERTRVQEEFIRDDVKIICATVAFGMGIDKSNIRWIIHYNLPAKMEGYYQEIGRAGRDGLKSDALLFYGMGDLMMLTRFANESGQPKLNREKLKRMQEYAEARVCRRRILLSYFGETRVINCNNCDVCAAPTPLIEGTIAAQKAISAIVRTGEQVGFNMVIQILRGSQSNALIQNNYHQLKTYGIGKEHSFEAWQAYLLQFLQLGLIEMAYEESFSLKVTKHGYEVLQGKLKVEIVDATLMRNNKLEYDDFEETNEEEEMLDMHLFEQLKKLRKTVADSEGFAPDIVFTDKSLFEMATRLPVSREALLATEGVSQHKFEKYGDEFLQLLLHESSRKQSNKRFSPETDLSPGAVIVFCNELNQKKYHVSPAGLSKILLGKVAKNQNESIRQLSFFGMYENKIKHTDLNRYLKSLFETEAQLRVRQVADYFFTEQMYNNLPESLRESLKNVIHHLPLNRPNSTITNAHIQTARKSYPRSYEHWHEPETTLFRQVVAQTNDLQFISRLFLRSPDSIKSYYQKVFM